MSEINTAYLLTFPSATGNHDGLEVRRFASLSEAYMFVTEERLEKFLIEKITKTVVAERT